MQRWISDLNDLNRTQRTRDNQEFKFNWQQAANELYQQVGIVHTKVKSACYLLTCPMYYGLTSKSRKSLYNVLNVVINQNDNEITVLDCELFIWEMFDQRDRQDTLPIKSTLPVRIPIMHDQSNLQIENINSNNNRINQSHANNPQQQQEDQNEENDQEDESNLTLMERVRRQVYNAATNANAAIFNAFGF